MIADSAIQEKIRDLLFEVEESRTAKFLICVCDDRKERRDIRRQVIATLRKNEKTINSISAKNAKGALLTAFFTAGRDPAINCINVWGIPGMRQTAADELFTELNFHRDAITSLSLPVLIWITSSQVQRMAGVAPDFWSRRTAVYLFNKPATKTLLAKLFSRFRDTTPERSEIANAFQQILRSEKALARRLRKQEDFSVESVDEELKNLESNLRYLIDQCRGGGRLEVALWLWNATGIERDLHYFVDSLDPAERNVYGYVYSDRTEALLYMAERMPSILGDYAEKLKQHVSKKKRANIVGFFRARVIGRCNEILDELDLRQRKVIAGLPAASLPSEDETAHYRAHYEESETSPAGRALTSVYDLESWLSGYSTKQPTFFTEDEGRLLRILYSESSSSAEIAERLGLPIRETKNRITRLENRVRQYLSAGLESIDHVLLLELAVRRLSPPNQNFFRLSVRDTSGSTKRPKPRTFANWDQLSKTLRATFHVSEMALRELRRELDSKGLAALSNVYVRQKDLAKARLQAEKR